MVCTMLSAGNEGFKMLSDINSDTPGDLYHFVPSYYVCCLYLSCEIWDFLSTATVQSES